MAEVVEKPVKPEVSFKEQLEGLGLEAEQAATVEEALKGLNLDQLIAVKEEAMRLIAEQREEKEAVERIPNPILALVEALKKGVKVMQSYRGIENLPRWAGRIANSIETAKIVSDKPDVEIARELVKRGEIPTGITLEELHESWGTGIRFYRQDVVPTLKALGALPEDAPTRLPYGNENGYLLLLFQKEGKITQVERPPEGEYRVGVIEFSKQSKIPGVSVAIGVQSDCLKNTQRYFNPDGLPLIRYTRLEFSPAALASFAAPSSGSEPAPK